MIRPIQRRVWGPFLLRRATGPQGPYDQTPVEQRSDVLVYTSAPLIGDTEVTGPTTVTCGRSHRRPTPTSPPSWTSSNPTARRSISTTASCARHFATACQIRGPRYPGQPYEYRIPDLADELPVPTRRPDPRGDFQQRLSAVRAQPQHRRTVRPRHRLPTSDPNDPARLCASLQVDSADHSGRQQRNGRIPDPNYTLTTTGHSRCNSRPSSDWISLSVLPPSVGLGRRHCAHRNSRGVLAEIPHLMAGSVYLLAGAGGGWAAGVCGGVVVA